MKFFNILRYDIQNGYLANPQKWYACILLYSFMFVSFTFTIFHGFYFDVKSIGNINSLGLSLGDVLIYCIGGNIPLFQTSGQNFTFPTLWFLSQILICYFTLDYLNNDLSHSGIQVIIRVKNKTIWWLSKCVCNVVTVTTYYALGYGVLFILSTVTAKTNMLQLTPTIFSFIFAQKLPLQDKLSGEMLLALCVIPCVVSICINLMQMTLTLFIKPIFAFLFTAIYLIVGIFYVHPIMLTNFAMPVRSSVIGIYNFTITSAFISCVFFSILAVVAGAIKINKKDIVNTVS